MREFINILKDIWSGALPVNEIPGFIGWALRKSARVWRALFIIVIAAWLLKSKRGRK